MSRADERFEPVAIVGRDPRREMQILMAMAAVTGLGTWLVGPSDHYAHSMHPPRRRARLAEPQKALPAPAALDTRDDKYLHAAARRRRAALLSALITQEVENGR